MIRRATPDFFLSFHRCISRLSFFRHGAFQVEATFEDGTKLLTVHDPIGREDGDLALALEGSFLPVPDLTVFGEEEGETGAVPGEVLVSATAPPVEINAAPATGAAPSGGPHLIEMAVTNTGDRPIQVGSHYRECGEARDNSRARPRLREGGGPKILTGAPAIVCARGGARLSPHSFVYCSLGRLERSRLLPDFN